MSRPVFVDSRHTLLASLIDYAGLFPPASLDLGDAAAEYRAARGGPHAWMLGAFVIPASRLEELAGLLVRTMATGEAPWEISVILDGAPGPAAAQAAAFEAELAPAVVITMVEVKLPPGVGQGQSTSEEEAGRAFAAAASVSGTVMPFLEVPVTASWHNELLAAVALIDRLRTAARRRAGAKLRCGGSAPQDFPEPAAVAGFMVACRDRGLPFKATAGLHHPIRHLDANVGIVRHGFLNLLVAAALSESGADERTVEAIIAEQDRAAFTIGAAGVGWRDMHADANAVEQTRSGGFSSYGSCSFDEPVEDLEALDLLPRSEP